MSSDRPNQTLADYVALAISPALIMVLVTSLVFFLLEVFYAGEYVARMRWILFFFVFGAVLVARISMSGNIATRASVYGLPLGVLTWIGLQTFVNYPDTGGIRALSWFLNLALIGIVWWCVHRLTWDCTQIDEETEVSGAGLLQAAGFEESAERGAPSAEKEVETKKRSWWERYQRYREQRSKRRTLGVWVVYFSLGALPLFGLGQALLPVEDLERRRTAFWLMMAYVASGLGLLLTTCFLGLRRYLRQRRLQMPAAMTGMWLALGGTLIAVLLVVGAVLPRPQAEYGPFRFRGAGSDKASASRWAVKGDSPGKDGGRAASDAPPPGQKAGEGQDGQGQGRGKDGKATGKDGKATGKDGSKRGQGGTQKGKEGQGQDGGQRGQGGKDRQQAGKGEAKQGQQNSSGQQSSAGSAPGQTASRLGNLVRKLGPILKWVVFAVLAVVVLIVVLRGALQFLANFSDWARNLLDALRNFWAGLFAGRAAAGDEGEEDVQEERRPAPRPFASFRNPFADGASRMKMGELLRYSFAALEAWARERDLTRQTGETPLEFVDRLGAEVPALEADARRFVLLYARSVYGPGGLPGHAAETVRAFWDRLEAAADQPLSA